MGRTFWSTRLQIGYKFSERKLEVLDKIMSTNEI